MTVSVCRRSRKHGDDDLRPERADDLHRVAEHRVVRPVLERLLGRLREAEVELAPEELAAAVNPAVLNELSKLSDEEVDRRLAELLQRKGRR